MRTTHRNGRWSKPSLALTSAHVFSGLCFGGVLAVTLPVLGSWGPGALKEPPTPRFKVHVSFKIEV
jgi:hypothetical protein